MACGKKNWWVVAPAAGVLSLVLAYCTVPEYAFDGGLMLDSCPPSSNCNNQGCVDLNTAVQHCGACNHACTAGENQFAVCDAGQCGTVCAESYAHCEGGDAGCETRLADNPRHCGACDHACAAGPGQVPVCDGGRCGAACRAPLLDCDGDPANGCEVDPTGDVLHCGACAGACPAVAHGAAKCTQSSCAIDACEPGFADCDGLYATGCETDLSTPGHCGSCLNTCVAAHAAAACSNGACVIGTCSTPFLDCDGVYANGCEVDGSTDAAHCGACNVACGGATPRCSQRTCVP